MRILTFILILISFQTFAQKVKQVKNKISDIEYETYTIIKEKGKPAYKHGEYKHFRDNRLIEYGDISKGQKVGKWIESTKEGRLEYFYTLGNIDSLYGPINNEIVAIKFDLEGKPISKYYYSSPIKTIKIPSKNGTKYIKTTNQGFIENDTIAQGNIANDTMEGIWEFKNADGSLCTLQFTNGHLVGKQSSTYSNGNPYSVMNYNDLSELDGPYTINYENGDTLYYQNYKNGKQDGYGTAKYKDRRTYYTAYYDHGKIITYTEHNICGANLQKSKVENGNGQIVEYAWVNDQIKVTKLTNYFNGVLHGMRFHYNANTVLYSEKFENGIFVSYGIAPGYERARDENDTTFPRVNFDLVDSTKLIKSSFSSGEDGLQRFIAENVTYPPLALENDKQGRVNVMFVVDRLGNVVDATVLGKKLGFGLDEESIEVINATSGMWTPALYYGMPVKMRFRIPVKYQIY